MSGASMAAANSHSNNDDKQQSGVPLPTHEEEWISYIQESSRVDGRSPSVVSIFRVPGALMKVSKNRGAYVPKRVSLGPYHHGRSAGLAAIEQHKPRALCRMMERVSGEQPGPNNMDFAVRARKAIVQVQEVIKNNYDGDVKYEGEILSTMLTLDSCFILEIMRVLVYKMPYEAYDPLFERKRLLHVERDLLNDILKLENQIPLIVLQRLLQLELQQDDVTDTLCEMVLRFLLIFYPFGNEEKKAYVDDGHLLSILRQRLLLEDQGHHLLDFFHTLVVFAPFGDAGNNSVFIDFIHTGGEHAQYTRLSNERDDDAVVVEDIPCAVDLANAGIKFKKCLGGIKNIHFEPTSATLYLPSLIVNGGTELRFLNLIAFELQKRFQTNYVMNYVYLMKKLIVTEEDVSLLMEQGIVNNSRGSNVAQLFDNLSNEIVITPENFMDGLLEESEMVRLVEHTKYKWYSYRAELLNDYFSTPWKILGVGAATLLLALSIVQTVFIILTLYK